MDGIAAKTLDAELAAAEGLAVDVGDLRLAAGRRPRRGGDLGQLVVVEIQPRDGEMVIHTEFARRPRPWPAP